jgi:hypothetical protein
MKNKETLEEAAAKHFNKEDLVEGVNIQYSMQSAFIEGAKHQAERMYSEEDMRESFRQGHSAARKGSYNQITEQEDFEKWFEQFKKK